MEEYKSYSHKSRAEAAKKEHKVEKIVTGTVKSKKKGGFHKFTDVFISEDAVNVKSYIFMDVIIPTIKKALYDGFTTSLEMLLYGETGRKKNSNASRISYRDYYKDDRNLRERSLTRNGYDFNDIVINNRGEAEDVLSSMDELIENYGSVSVADFYDLVGITGNYTDNNYGWTDIRSANVIRVRDGYMIKLPRASLLN